MSAFTRLSAAYRLGFDAVSDCTSWCTSLNPPGAQAAAECNCGCVCYDAANGHIPANAHDLASWAAAAGIYVAATQHWSCLLTPCAAPPPPPPPPPGPCAGVTCPQGATPDPATCACPPPPPPPCPGVLCPQGVTPDPSSCQCPPGGPPVQQPNNLGLFLGLGALAIGIGAVAVIESGGRA